MLVKAHYLNIGERLEKSLIHFDGIQYEKIFFFTLA